MVTVCVVVSLAAEGIGVRHAVAGVAILAVGVVASIWRVEASAQFITLAWRWAVPPLPLVEFPRGPLLAPGVWPEWVL